MSTTNIGVVAAEGATITVGGSVTGVQHIHADHVDLCSACGHPGSDQDPLVHDIKCAGWLVHLRHYNDPGSGFYGEPYHQS